MSFDANGTPTRGEESRQMSDRRLPTGSQTLRAYALATGLGLLLLQACSDSEGPMPENRAPVTFLSIQGAELDTLDYRQVMYWWGSDTDGRVTGYLVKWDGDWTPPEDAISWPADPSFVYTEATTDTFVVPTNGLFAERVFEVYAVDDDGAVDPVGQRQRFKLKNWLPDLDWSHTVALPKSSLPAVTFAWTPRDLDGRETVRYFRYWLDGEDSTAAPLGTDSLIALTPADFDGRLGERTLKVQAYDEALAASNVITHRWTVEAATGDYLLIDNVSSNVPAFSREDGFFRAVLDSIGAGNYFIYDVETRGDFRSDKEIEPLFGLFKGVVWYSGFQNVGNDASMLRNLQTAEKGLREYLDDGGRVLIAATNAVGDTAGLSVRFAETYFGIDDFYRLRGQNDIPLARGAGIDIGFVATEDTLGTGVTMVATDFLIPGVEGEGLFKLRRNLPTLSGAEPDPADTEAWIGMMRRNGASRAAVLSLPISIANRPPGVSNRYGAALMRRIFLD